MKKVIIIAFISSFAIFSSIAIYATYVVKQDVSLTDLYMGNIESLTSDESADDCDGAPGKCLAGGCGASSCSLSRQIQIGILGCTVGQTVSATVEADPGYFACCYVIWHLGLVADVRANPYKNACCPS